jgi:hypothetical protein
MSWLQRLHEQRKTRSDMAVIGLIASGVHGVTEMWQQIGGSVARIYLALDRLERAGVVCGKFVDSSDPGFPARRFYYLVSEWPARLPAVTR